jgi:hypothetical protein
VKTHFRVIIQADRGFAQTATTQMSLLFWTDLKHTQTNMKIYRTFWNHTPAPPRQPDFLSNNGFSYVNILYVGTEYEKERNSERRERKKKVRWLAVAF